MTWLSETSGMASSGVRSVAQMPTPMMAAYSSRTMKRLRAESSMIRVITVDAPQLRFRIEQEAAFDDDALSLAQTRGDDDRVAVASAGRDLARLVGAGAGFYPDELLLPAIDDRAGRDHDVRR